MTISESGTALNSLASLVSGSLKPRMEAMLIATAVAVAVVRGRPVAMHCHQLLYKHVATSRHRLLTERLGYKHRMLCVSFNVDRHVTIRGRK